MLGVTNPYILRISNETQHIRVSKIGRIVIIQSGYEQVSIWIKFF